MFRIVNEVTLQPVETPATRALREGVVVGLANHTVLIKKDVSECPIDDSAAPIRDEQGHVSGCVLIFRDVTVQRLIELEKANQLHTAEQAVGQHISLVIPVDRLDKEEQIIANLKAGRRIEQHEPSVDIGLPKLDGHEVCRRVREQPWEKEVMVIALTGWGQEDDRRKSEEAGFKGHLVKPVGYDKLLELLG